MEFFDDEDENLRDLEEEYNTIQNRLLNHNNGRRPLSREKEMSLKQRLESLGRQIRRIKEERRMREERERMMRREDDKKMREIQNMNLRYEEERRMHHREEPEMQALISQMQSMDLGIFDSDDEVSALTSAHYRAPQVTTSYPIPETKTRRPRSATPEDIKRMHKKSRRGSED